MALHAAEMFAVVAVAVQQVPVVVQCAQAAQEIFWQSSTKIVQELIPVAGGVFIAWMAFQWNSKSEHKRWILDQKKLEWRELLDAIKVCEDFLPLTGASLVDLTPEEVPASVKSDAYERTRRVQQLFYDRLFVDHSVLGEVLSRWNDVNEMIRMEKKASASEYTAAYIGLVDFARRAARKDIGVRD